jgi:molybdopterin-containing oxidoreductase family membrane subunit
VPDRERHDDERLFAPVMRAGRGFWILAACAGVLGFVGLVAWLVQLREGLSVTGLNVPVYWGLYITHIVFFIGISHAGTLISAILRLSNAEWRRPITRAAEVITVLVLFFGMGCILLDLGRPDRALFVLRHGNLRSPLLWDVISVTTYITASTI